MIDTLAIFVVTTIVGGWLASVEYKLRRLEDNMTVRPTRDEIDYDLTTRLKAVEDRHNDLKEDVLYIRLQLDKLIDRLTQK